MIIIELVIQGIALFLILAMFLYAWLYLRELRGSKQYVGINPPRAVENILHFCLTFSLISAIVILFFLVMAAFV